LASAKRKQTENGYYDRDVLLYPPLRNFDFLFFTTKMLSLLDLPVLVEEKL